MNNNKSIVKGKNFHFLLRSLVWNFLQKSVMITASVTVYLLSIPIEIMCSIFFLPLLISLGLLIECPGSLGGFLG